jgi:hypothetical protein
MRLSWLLTDPRSRGLMTSDLAIGEFVKSVSECRWPGPSTARVTWPGRWDVEGTSDLARTFACLPICLLVSTGVARCERNGHVVQTLERADAAIAKIFVEDDIF